MFSKASLYLLECPDPEHLFCQLPNICLSLPNNCSVFPKQKHQWKLCSSLNLTCILECHIYFSNFRVLWFCNSSKIRPATTFLLLFIKEAQHKCSEVTEKLLSNWPCLLCRSFSLFIYHNLRQKIWFFPIFSTLQWTLFKLHH